MYFQLQINPVSCGEFCGASSVQRTDYDVDNYRAISQLLVKNQPLTASSIEYIKQYFCIYCEPKCQSLPMADYYELGTAKIVSEKLKGIFQTAGVAGEYIPIKTLDEFHNDSGGFYLAHFQPIIDCFDYERSQFTWVERKAGKRPSKLKLLEINESVIADSLPLFRIKYFENMVIVKDSLAEAINSSDIRGVLFLPLPVEEFDSSKLIHQLELDCSKKENHRK
ncbi:MAG: DUF1629 domain-containing protein [Candidatus Thiodiazotropha sp.]